MSIGQEFADLFCCIDTPPPPHPPRWFQIYNCIFRLIRDEQMKRSLPVSMPPCLFHLRLWEAKSHFKIGTGSPEGYPTPFNLLMVRRWDGLFSCASKASPLPVLPLAQCGVRSQKVTIRAWYTHVITFPCGNPAVRARHTCMHVFLDHGNLVLHEIISINSILVSHLSLWH